MNARAIAGSKEPEALAEMDRHLEKPKALP